MGTWNPGRGIMMRRFWEGCSVQRFGRDKQPIFFGGECLTLEFKQMGFSQESCGRPYLAAKKTKRKKILRFVRHFFNTKELLKNKVLSCNIKGNSDGITSRDADRRNSGMGSRDNLPGNNGFHSIAGLFPQAELSSRQQRQTIPVVPALMSFILLFYDQFRFEWSV